MAQAINNEGNYTGDVTERDGWGGRERLDRATMHFHLRWSGHRKVSWVVQSLAVSSLHLASFLSKTVTFHLFLVNSSVSPPSTVSSSSAATIECSLHPLCLGPKSCFTRICWMSTSSCTLQMLPVLPPTAVSHFGRPRKHQGRPWREPSGKPTSKADDWRVIHVP